jgi:hypothetical protein
MGHFLPLKPEGELSMPPENFGIGSIIENGKKTDIYSSFPRDRSGNQSSPSLSLSLELALLPPEDDSEF